MLKLKIETLSSRGFLLFGNFVNIGLRLLAFVAKVYRGYSNVFVEYGFYFIE